MTKKNGGGQGPFQRWVDCRQLVPRTPAAAEYGLEGLRDSVYDVFMRCSRSAKAQGQLLADLTGMQIGMSELAKGTMVVRGEVVHVRAEFVLHVNDTVTEVGCGAEADVGLYIFYAKLLAPLHIGAGNIPASWDAMVSTLQGIAPITIETVVESYSHECAMEEKMESLSKQLSSAHISTLTCLPPALTLHPNTSQYELPQIAPQYMQPPQNATTQVQTQGAGSLLTKFPQDLQKRHRRTIKPEYGFQEAVR
ncbi:hypothetical protein B0H19DRAFT_1065272 [Mycena capillaripes]|nr:hypothetical protein B0H19DRAFT_1065272 [Mycena capillaripes]